ncbi:cytochrome C oxidase subunit IV family protein [Thauera sp. JM12B12]|uniref:cytochrome C oxidase subunit IV family protein n=1 Tax=Thauera sp. JM12B12 TaxID=3142262 RepID=UPI0031F3C611
MNAERKLDLAWVALVLLSIGGARLGSGDDDGFAIAALVALVMAVKLLIVSRYFLELHEAHPRIRRAVYLFCYGMPILVILTTGFREPLARLTGAALI